MASKSAGFSVQGTTVMEGGEVWVTAMHDELPGWTVRYRVVEKSRPEIVEIHVVADGTTQPGGLTTVGLRAITIGGLLSASADKIDLVANAAGPVLKQRLKKAVRQYTRQPHPGRAGQGDQFYAQVAAAYVARTHERDCVATLAAELHASTSTLRSWLSQARRRGLLEAAPSGRAGGELTEKARELLGA